MQTRKSIEKQLSILKANYDDLNRKQNSIKLVSNSSFGQTGQRFAKIYDIRTMLNTTVAGQLTILMYMENILKKVPSANIFYSNTDSVMLKLKKKDLSKLKKIITKLDGKSKLTMEYDFYKHIAIRDVNNYVGVYENGIVKAKGAFAERDLEKNPVTPIVFEAVRLYLQKGTPVEDTINNCKKVTDFCTSRNVTGGAMFAKEIPEMYPDGWDESLVRNKRITKKMESLKEKLEAVWVKEHGGYLGKVVRFYYSMQGLTLHYKKSGNRVPMTSEGNGVTPLMDLPKKLPKDINYKWYIDYAYRMLEDLGVTH